MASWELLMQTCWWPLNDHWSVQLTSLVWVFVVWQPESLMELSALCKWHWTSIFHPLCLGPFYWHAITLIIAWMTNYIHYKMWDEITFPFPNFNTAQTRQIRTPVLRIPPAVTSQAKMKNWLHECQKWASHMIGQYAHIQWGRTLIFNPMQDHDPSDISTKNFLDPLKRMRVVIRTSTDGVG